VTTGAGAAGSGEPDLARIAGLAPGSRVLDVGCGEGRAAGSLGAAGARAFLLDRSLACLEAAASGPAAGRPRVRADAAALPFGAAAFDGVVLRALLHHLADPLAAVREAARVVRTGGVVVLVDMRAPEEFAARARYNAVARLRHEGHRWSHAPSELRALVEGGARLRIEEGLPWEERRDAARWLERGTPGEARRRFALELLEAEADRPGGGAFAARDAGDLVLVQGWIAVRARKPEPGERRG
jgi:SAM-dependent methyltransferase